MKENVERKGLECKNKGRRMDAKKKGEKKEEGVGRSDK